jgi:hypothetical protein
MIRSSNSDLEVPFSFAALPRESVGANVTSTANVPMTMNEPDSTDGFTRHRCGS